MILRNSELIICLYVYINIYIYIYIQGRAQIRAIWSMTLFNTQKYFYMPLIFFSSRDPAEPKSGIRFALSPTALFFIFRYCTGEKLNSSSCFIGISGSGTAYSIDQPHCATYGSIHIMRCRIFMSLNQFADRGELIPEKVARYFWSKDTFF